MEMTVEDAGDEQEVLQAFQRARADAEKTVAFLREEMRGKSVEVGDFVAPTSFTLVPSSMRLFCSILHEACAAWGTRPPRRDRSVLPPRCVSLRLLFPDAIRTCFCGPKTNASYHHQSPSSSMIRHAAAFVSNFCLY
jgi:hypothetical protein